MTASVMTFAALAFLSLGFLVHSTHCEGAGPGQNGPNPMVLGPYYTCLTDGRLQMVTYTGPRYAIRHVEYFDKNSDDALEHCDEDEEW